jgi:GAF domain-containing protein
VSIVDTDRIWFKSHHGLDVQQITRDMGLCASAVMQYGPWLVNDAPRDPRTLTNPLVAGEFGLGFYLGIPLQTNDGFNLGTLCVLDFRPRTVSQDQIDHLSDLASVVMDQLELRLSARLPIADLSAAIEQKEAAYRQAALLAKEIDHRVMNSLQLIANMLTLQSVQLRGAPGALEISNRPLKYPSLMRSGALRRVVGSHFLNAKHVCEHSTLLAGSRYRVAHCLLAP